MNALEALKIAQKHGHYARPTKLQFKGQGYKWTGETWMMEWWDGVKQPALLPHPDSLFGKWEVIEEL